MAPHHGSTTDPHLLQTMILNKTDTPVAVGVEVLELHG